MRDRMSGTVQSINLSARKTERKAPVASATLMLDRGLQSDAHAGNWHRQVSLLGVESIVKMVARGLRVGPGDFAENLTTAGLDLLQLPVGTTLRVGAEAVLEVSQLGKICHARCAIYHQAGDCVMPREGIFAVVRAGGVIAVGDSIEVLELGAGACARTPPNYPVPTAAELGRPLPVRRRDEPRVTTEP